MFKHNTLKPQSQQILTDYKADLVSIVMPFYNEAEYLDSCINSIKEQSYAQWELIAVDDQSTDDSLRIAYKWAEQDERIKVLRNDNQGVINALRKAYAHSQGAWITRMDADDLMAKNRLQQMLTELREHGQRHIAVGKVRYFREDQALGDGYQRYADWLNALSAHGANFKEIYKECTIPSPCWMMHRQDFDQIGGFESDIYPEDYDLAFRMYGSGMKVIPCQDDILLHWRDYPTRSSRTSELYADNRFINLKVNHFLTIDHRAEMGLVLWGAGKKGKAIAKELIANKVEFHWITDNHNKLGHNIYGKILQSSDLLDTTDQYQIIISIAKPAEQEDIKARLNTKEHLCFWFC